MRAEARRIQERVAHEREIRHAMLLRGPMGFDSDDSDVGDGDDVALRCDEAGVMLYRTQLPNNSQGVPPHLDDLCTPLPITNTHPI